MEGNISSRAKHIEFIISDMFALEVSFLIAYYLRFVLENSEVANYRQINIILFFSYLFIILAQPIHSGILKRGYLKEFSNVLLVDIEMLAVLLVILFIMKETDEVSRLFIGLLFLFNLIFSYLLRLLIKIIIYGRFKKAVNKTHVIIVCYRDNAVNTLNQIMMKSNGSIEVDRFMLLDQEKRMTPIEGIKVMYRQEMQDFLRTHIVDEVYIGSKARDVGKLINWFLSMGVIVHIMTEVFVHEVPNVRIDKIGTSTCITTTISPITTGQKLVKRVFDIGISLVGLVVLAVSFVIFAPVIFIQSPGPVIFSQVRVGLNGRHFKMYKFRTMYPDAEAHKKELLKDNEIKGQMFKLGNDPRIIPIGKFLRRSSIDELPQFINILKGDMSLVGTRPPTLDEFERYKPHHMSRLAMKPGLTGLWQISGRSDITDFEQVVALDTQYITNYSLGLDVEIILKTFAAVISGKGSK
ncbi:exopolysaccharide biosynthesis polyprenyl glycosylphosphotransferase [Ruminococcaceae bacterium YRB3002]|nr:exopolysaccharide biosynthesis polyprenyl glycosylphosphotransferase [Ruminococcaceae bacterium YRB3002]